MIHVNVLQLDLNVVDLQVGLLRAVELTPRSQKGRGECGLELRAGRVSVRTPKDGDGAPTRMCENSKLLDGPGECAMVDDDPPPPLGPLDPLDPNRGSGSLASDMTLTGLSISPPQTSSSTSTGFG